MRSAKCAMLNCAMRSAKCGDYNGLEKHLPPETVRAIRNSHPRIAHYGYPFPLSPIGAIGLASGFRSQMTIRPHFESPSYRAGTNASSA